jgi:hypothetical protein
MTKLKFYICLLFLSVLTACDSSDALNGPYPFTELAMRPNMIIEAVNKHGKVSIEHLSQLERRYRWDDYDEKRTLIPRTERWQGQLGAYDPASSYIWEIFKPRIVAVDSQLHFTDVDEADSWLHQSSAVMDWVYTDDGLVLGFVKSPERNQVNIEVYQIYIDGDKPTKLQGSRPNNISISFDK